MTWGEVRTSEGASRELYNSDCAFLLTDQVRSYDLLVIILLLPGAIRSREPICQENDGRAFNKGFFNTLRSVRRAQTARALWPRVMAEKVPVMSAMAGDGKEVKRVVSWWLQSFLILGEIAGQGVFALPLHLGRLGWLLGTLTCLGTIALNNISLRVMYSVHTRFPELHSQAHAAGSLFGGWKATLVKTVVRAYLFVIMSAFINSLGRIIMNELYETRVCLPVATAVALLVSFPFCQLRSFGDITVISLVSFAALLVCLVLIMSVSSHVQPDPTATRSFLPPLGAVDSLTSIGGFFFASGGGQCAFFEYLTEMERPSDYPKTLALTSPILFALYYGSAAIMYQRFGNKVPGFLMDILPFDSTRLLGNTLFFFHIIVSLTILNSALLRAFATHSVTDTSWAAKREWALMSVYVLGLAWFLTNLLGQQFEDITAAFGALIVTFTVLVIPPMYLLAASDASARRDEEKPKPKAKSKPEPAAGDGKYGSGTVSGARDEGEGAGAGGSVSPTVRVALWTMLAVGVVAVPSLTWGAASKLVVDAREVSPPFSCGPCVTRQCAETTMEESKAKKKAMEDELFPERFHGEPVYPGAPDTTMRFSAPSGEEWRFTSPDEGDTFGGWDATER